MLSWEAITYVSSGLSLVALFAMLAAWAFKTKTEERERLIRTAKSDQRTDLVRNALEFFHIEPNNLTKEQQYNLALEQIRARALRFKISAAVICFLTISASAISTYALYKYRNEPQRPVAGPVPEVVASTKEDEVQVELPETQAGSSAWMYVGTRVGNEWRKTAAEGIQPVKTLDIEGFPELDGVYKVTYPVFLRASLPTKESAAQRLTMSERKGLLHKGRKVLINQVVQMPLSNPERTWVWAYVVVVE